ncbi:MAG TPA: 5-formyltetrahydrofolate cyclo-ligase [Candidatus Gastranaerophilales bacterium]|nr:5-formyltetrahydrofolate cyclo-ligase [Candidatus Gastranaerophilales bacterium]
MFSKEGLKSKEEYRFQAKEIRKNLNTSLISAAICRLIIDMKEYKQAKIIAGFYPFDKEINIRPLFEDSSKKWFLPKVKNDDIMVFYPYTNFFDMEKNKFGIYEPREENELNPEKIDIIIIPALIADKTGYRLGYGKGYYDKFLARLSKKRVKIVPIPEELMIEKLPFDKFDVPVDFAVTQNKIYDFRVKKGEKNAYCSHNDKG